MKIHRPVHTNLILYTLFFSSLNQANEILDHHINRCNQGYTENCTTVAKIYHLKGESETAAIYSKRAINARLEKLAIECAQGSISQASIQSCLECAQMNTENHQLESAQTALIAAYEKAAHILNSRKNQIKIIKFTFSQLDNSKTAWTLFMKHLDETKNRLCNLEDKLSAFQCILEEVQAAGLPQEYIAKIQKNITQIEDEIKAKTKK